MDWLDRQQEEEERFRNLNTEEPELKKLPHSAQHNVTLIGMIRGADGWYRCGFDESTRTIVPLELVEKANNEFMFCRFCKHSHPMVSPISGKIVSQCKFDLIARDLYTPACLRFREEDTCHKCTEFREDGYCEKKKHGVDYFGKKCEEYEEKQK